MVSLRVLPLARLTPFPPLPTLCIRSDPDESLLSPDAVVEDDETEPDADRPVWAAAAGTLVDLLFFFFHLVLPFAVEDDANEAGDEDEAGDENAVAAVWALFLLEPTVRCFVAASFSNDLYDRRALSTAFGEGAYTKWARDDRRWGADALAFIAAAAAAEAAAVAAAAADMSALLLEVFGKDVRVPAGMAVAPRRYT